MSERTTGLTNLWKWWDRSSTMDREYGEEAYRSYHDDIVPRFWPLPARLSCAVFALTSPNNDYNGNVESTRIVIESFASQIPVGQIQGATTYRACMERAYRLLSGHPISTVFGPAAQKTYNFYRNVLDPDDPRYVTIDGHMYNMWRGERSTLKSAARAFRPNLYKQIAEDFRTVAAQVDLLPNQLQGTLWWAWKRTHGIRFKYQMELMLESMETN